MSVHKQKQVLQDNEIYLNKDICKILLDNNWWDTIESLQEILLPYVVF